MLHESAAQQPCDLAGTEHAACQHSFLPRLCLRIAEYGQHLCAKLVTVGGGIQTQQETVQGEHGLGLALTVDPDKIGVYFKGDRTAVNTRQAQTGEPGEMRQAGDFQL